VKVLHLTTYDKVTPPSLPKSMPGLVTGRLKCLEIIGDNLKKRGWSLSFISPIDSNGRTSKTKVLYAD